MGVVQWVFLSKYCLWVLGNAATLVKSGSNWKQLVIDSKARGCFFDVKKEYSLTQAIVSATIDFGQIETFLSMDSPLFKTAKWKILFGDNFSKSMARITDTEICKEVISLLVKLSSGWRTSEKHSMLSYSKGSSSKLLEIYSVRNFILPMTWPIDGNYASKISSIQNEADQNLTCQPVVMCLRYKRGSSRCTERV
uniref:Uncharacterized protein n=1 Tax=Solanum lycopersicum TaxID=4081 RepID=K4C438_SOLLC